MANRRRNASRMTATDRGKAALHRRWGHELALAMTLVVALTVAPSLGGAPDPPLLFTDVTVASGIDFIETIGDHEMSNIVESSGVGCGFLDYDGDGWLDIFLVNGCWPQNS